jgi:hypothetical protein
MHLEGGLAGPRMNPDVAFVLLHDDVVGDVQTQARAMTRRFGGKEGVKDFRLNGLRDAGAVVLDLDHDPLSFGARADHDLALALDRINRIVNDVRPNLIEFAAIGHDLRQRRPVFTPNNDTRSQFAVQDAECVI